MDGSKLTYEELVAILKRSTEIQQRNDGRRFGKSDLVDMAREMGVDPDIATNLLEEHLARRSLVQLESKPFNTRIKLDVADDTFHLRVPPLRIDVAFFVLLVVLSGIFAFAYFWTEGALSSGNSLFLAFSLPLWWVGLVSSWRILMSRVQSTEFRLDRTSGSLVVSPFGTRLSLQTEEIRMEEEHFVTHGIDELLDQFGEPADEKENAKEKVNNQPLTLEHGVDTIKLVEGYTVREKRWVEGELRSWLLTLGR